MKMICIPVQLNDECTMVWLSKVGKGFSPDKSLLELVGFDADMEVRASYVCEKYLLNRHYHYSSSPSDTDYTPLT